MRSGNNRPAVLFTTAEDESFLLGTRSQLASLAERLLGLLRAPAEPGDWDGIRVEQPTCTSSLTDPLSDIALNGIVIVATEEDRRVLINKVRVNHGDEAIDWVAHDEWRKRNE